MGEANNPQNARSITPWPSDHRAALTTVEVELIPTPALITVEPRPVREDDKFLLRIASPEGGKYSATFAKRSQTTAITGISDVARDDRPTIRLSTIGLAQVDSDGVIADTTGKEIARARIVFLPHDGDATLKVISPVTPTSDVTLHVTDEPGFKLDWIGLYKRTTPRSTTTQATPIPAHGLTET